MASYITIDGQNAVPKHRFTQGAESTRHRLRDSKSRKRRENDAAAGRRPQITMGSISQGTLI